MPTLCSFHTAPEYCKQASKSMGNRGAEGREEIMSDWDYHGFAASVAATLLRRTISVSACQQRWNRRRVTCDRARATVNRPDGVWTMLGGGAGDCLRAQVRGPKRGWAAPARAFEGTARRPHSGWRSERERQGSDVYVAAQKRPAGGPAGVKYGVRAGGGIQNRVPRNRNRLY